MKSRSRKMAAMLAFFLTFALLVTGVPVALAAGSDIVTFADANLKQALISAGADTSGDGELMEGELAVLQETLDLSGKSISNLTGLQFATGISGLNLSGNAVSDISVLSGFTGLTSLDLSGNDLHDISALYNVSSPPGTLALKTLNVSDNYLDAADGSADRLVIDAMITAGCTVTYKPQKIIPVSGVKLSLSSIEMCPGDTATLSATVAPTDAADREVTWQSSNESVVTVQNGVVTAVTQGAASITVTTKDGSFSDVCDINVNKGTLSSTVYIMNTSILWNVAVMTTVDAFKGNFSNDAADLVIYDRNGALFNGPIVATGMTVRLVVGGVERDSRKIVVDGDTTGDGKVSVDDYTLLRLHLIGTKRLDGVFATAGDYTKDSHISVADYVRMRMTILGKQDNGIYLPDLPEVKDSRIRNFLNKAIEQLGKPYVWGAEGPDSFDCSGFIHYCLNQTGYSVGRTTADKYSRYTKWQYVSRDALQPGDLMFYYSDTPNDGDHIGHVGIYLGNGYHIHASSDYGCIIICGVEGWYDQMLSHGRRVFY